jgi:hypothetical protein
MKLMTVEELMPQGQDEMFGQNNMLKDDVAFDDSE